MTDDEVLNLIRTRLQLAVDKEMKRLFANRDSVPSSEMMMVSDVNWVIGFIQGVQGN